MEISIELLAVGVPIMFGICFWLLLTLVKYIRLWKYKPENDKSKKAEERRIKNIRSKDRGKLEVSSTNEPRKDSESIRKVRRNPFRRNRR